MGVRKAHGAAARSGRLAVVEVMPADEQPKAAAAGADPLSAGRDAAGRLTTSDAARALARLPRRSRHVPRKLACDPRFEPHNRMRLEWLRARRAEHQQAHGGVSHGVHAMLASAAWLYSGGEFAAELAAESGDVEGFRTAAVLTAQARSHELGAWELGARESVSRQAAADRAKWASYAQPTAEQIAEWTGPDEQTDTTGADAGGDEHGDDD